MKNLIRSHFLLSPLFLGLVFCLVSAVSCTNPFLVNPNTNGIDVAERSIMSPKNVYATNGDFRKITLSWDSVQNAKQYRIYSAASPFEDIMQIGETSGNETEFSLSVSSGKTLWFRVSAVSFGGEESFYSSYVQGSSIDIPNITDIALGKDGTSATVRWWMGNCKASTYKDSVAFRIICYESDKTQIADEKTADGSDSSVTFYNLKNKSVYYYQVVASVGEFDSETSDFYDAETARRTTPNPPENLECDKGIGKSSGGINVSWNLPEAVDIKVSGNNYEEHPIYFSLERKLFSESEDEYKVLASYIGTCRNVSSSSSSQTSSPSSNPSSSASQVSSFRKEIYFTCEKDAEFGNLKVSVQGTDKENAVANYPNYIAGAKLTYNDKNVEPGKKYTYRIRSYTDDAGSRIISSDSSVAECEGWLISNPSLELSPDYELAKNSANAGHEKFSSISLKFSFEFEDFGLDSEKFYKYILTSRMRPFSEGGSGSSGVNQENASSYGSESLLGVFDSAENVNAFAKNYDSAFISDSGNQGYYSYKVYICPSAASGPEQIPSSESEYYSLAVSSGELTVTDDATKLPKIENFKVSDGFASKYILEWSYDSSYSYFLQWIEYDGLSGQPKSDAKHKIELKAVGAAGGTENPNESENLFTVETDTENTEKKTAKFEHKAESGDARKYSLIAKKDLQTTKDAENISMTLGTVNASMNRLDYRNISVVWKAVQKAEKYSVEAYYADDSAKKNLVKGEIVYAKSDEPSPVSENPMAGENPNTTITEFSSGGSEGTSLGEKSYSCVIAMPDGYSDAAKSGKEIVLSIKAENTNCKEDNTTTASVSARTLGPAELGVKSDGILSSNIKISWNEISGAKGYKVFRIPYSDNKGTQTKDGNVEYFVNASDSENISLERNGEKQLKEGSGVSKNGGRIYLNDIDDSDCLDDSAPGQRELSLGLPFAYVVIPVLSGDDEFKFRIAGNDFGGGDSGGVSYSDIEKSSAFVKASTFGYGLNVSASKAESSKTVQVSWERPFENGSGVPYIYRRENGNSEWKLLSSLNISDTSYNDSLSGMDKTKSYYYAVQYGSSQNSLAYKTSYKKHLEKSDARYSDLPENTEELNKGYLLYLDFSADYNGTLGSDGEYRKDEYYYSEKVSHKPWDFSERARGPSSFSISARNVNTTMGYIKLADITVDKNSSGGSVAGHEKYSVNSTFENILADDKSNDTKLVVSGSDLILSPIGLTNGTAVYTDGILKVLRSAKTYYKIESKLLNTRKDLASGESEAGEGGVSGGSSEEQSAKEAFFSEEVFGYRQISDEELVKAAMLILADKFNNTSEGSGSQRDSFYWTAKYEVWSVKYSLWLYINDYIHTWNRFPDTSFSASEQAFIKLSDKGGVRGRASDGYPSFLCYEEYKDFSSSKLIPITISVNGPADLRGNSLNSYNAVFKVAASDSNFTYEIWRNGAKVSGNTITGDLKYWNPMKLTKNGSYEGNSANYGWWQE